jgi:hypothetical protein
MVKRNGNDRAPSTIAVVLLHGKKRKKLRNNSYMTPEEKL